MKLHISNNIYYFILITIVEHDMILHNAFVSISILEKLLFRLNKQSL